jgi:transposase, IS6 family
VILLVIGRYLRRSPSAREQKELLAERGLHSDHVTVRRRVRPYASEMERPLRRQLKPSDDGWRIGETYIRVKSKRVYLHRAVDSIGATIDFLLSAKRDTVAAKRCQYSVPPGAFRSCARRRNRTVPFVLRRGECEL